MNEQLPEKKIKHGLCLSSGGAWGSCGLGTITRWNRDYDVVSGVSTGSLMAPLAALKEWDRLKEAYTSVNQSSIFTYNPFTRSGKIHLPKLIWRLIRNEKTLGDSGNLKKLIDAWFSDEDFLKLDYMGKTVIVAAQEIRRIPARIRYGNSQTDSFEQFKNLMWASANFPGMMSLFSQNGKEYVDGGLTELFSLCQLIAMGCTEIDIVVHRPRPQEGDRGPTKNIFHLVMRLFNIMWEEISDNDLSKGLLMAEAAGVKVNVCWLPRKLSDNSLMFDKRTMLGWWELGYQTAHDEWRFDRYDFSASKRPVLA